MAALRTQLVHRGRVANKWRHTALLGPAVSGGFMRLLLIVVIAALVGCQRSPFREHPRPDRIVKEADPVVATFSILAMDSTTGEIGGAVQSRVFSVGNGVLWAEAGVGAAATQAIVDVSYGPKALALLRTGMTPAAIIKAIWDSDPDPRPDRWTKEGRQFAVIDAKGNTAVYTGPKASTWAGHRQGKLCTAQGNILAGEPVVANMVKAFEETPGHLSLRLMAALDAGQAAGGDTRGMQSAAV